MLNFFCGLLLFIFAILTSSAGLRVYLTGTAEDAFTSPQPGLLLMGGGVDVDDPVRWFLTKADGGDIVVLRTSCSENYNTYLHPPPAPFATALRPTTATGSSRNREPSSWARALASFRLVSLTSTSTARHGWAV